MRTPVRKFGVVYASIVGLVALWAWYTDIRLLHSPTEHLLPDLLLGLVSLPSSKSLEPLCDKWPALCQMPFVQLAWFTVCGALQVGIVFLLSLLMPKKSRNLV